VISSQSNKNISGLMTDMPEENRKLLLRRLSELTQKKEKRKKN